MRRAQTAEVGKVVKKKNFPKSRKILAHAHWRRRGYVRAGPGPRKMEKLRKNFFFRKVEKNSRMRLSGTCRNDDKLSTAKLKIVKLKIVK